MSNKFLVTFWGTRGSIATPGRSTEKYGGNTSSVSIELNDELFIFDAGTGIRPLGVEVMRDRLPEEGKYNLNLFLSHTHWDHIQGLPFFQPAYHPSFAMNIYGSASQEGVMIKDLLIGQMDSSYFPVKLSQLGSEMAFTDIMCEKSMNVNGAELAFQELDHPGGSMSIKLKADGKSVVYATDNELDFHFTQEGNIIEGSELAQKYLDFVKGADLLIADGQYTAEEYEQKKGWGHTSVPTLLSVAHKAGVKQVAVFHHDPMHTDNFLDQLSANYLQKYQDAEPRMDIFWAREGLTLAI